MARLGLSACGKSALFVRGCLQKSDKHRESPQIWTRRALRHFFGPLYQRSFKEFLHNASPFVSFYMRSGPWKFSYVQYGRNPSESEDCAQFVVTFCTHTHTLTHTQLPIMGRVGDFPSLGAPTHRPAYPISVLGCVAGGWGFHRYQVLSFALPQDLQSAWVLSGETGSGVEFSSLDSFSHDEHPRMETVYVELLSCGAMVL